MSIIINITGNIATGKSTLAKHLNNHLSIPHISIDRYRKHYYDSTLAGEQHAQDRLCKDLTLMKSVILEHSGIGRYANEYQKSFDHTLTILCVIPIETITANIKERSPNYSPYIPDKWIRHCDPIEDALEAVKATAKQPLRIPVTYVYQYTTSKLNYFTNDIQHWLQSVVSHNGTTLVKD